MPSDPQGSDPGGQLALPHDVIRRLEGFAARIDELPVDQIIERGMSRADEDELDEARAAADGAAIANGRQIGLDKAIERMEDWVSQFLSRSPALGWASTALGLSGPKITARDYALVHRSFQDVVRAIVVSDLVGDDVRDTLLGEWGDFVP